MSLAVACLALAGCGGGDGGTTATTTAATTTAGPTTTVAAPDPGADAFAAFVAAARAGDAEALWELLSPETRERVGPTLEEFRAGVATELEEGVGSFRSQRVLVSERITDEFGVVAAEVRRRDGGRDAYAVPLRLVGAEWKVELGGPIVVAPIGPDPGARERVVAQVAASVRGPAGAATAVMWLDGQTLNPEVRGTATNATLFASLVPKLDPGLHSVVVFAAGARQASAVAWTFTVVT